MWALALAALCLTVAACQQTSAGQAGQAGQATSSVPTKRTVTIDTKDGARTAIVVHPTTAPPNAPLVVMLHGGFGSGKQAEAAYGWDDEAAREGFVVAYPNGVRATWNVGNCCGHAQKANVDDVGFLHALVTQLEETDHVDPKRIYAVGMSNGAIMTYTWACRDPGELAGIGPVAGTLGTPCSEPHPITVVAIHGTADEHVPIDGGVGPEGLTGVSYKSLADSIAPFLNADGCPASPVITKAPPLTTSVWSCAGEQSVTTRVVDGAGHQWPGKTPPSTAIAKLLGADPPSTAFDATDFLWQHLRASLSE